MRQIGDGAPVAQHEDPIGAFDDLLELRGNHQHAEALVGEFLDERLDLGLGADVDAARRLVEDEQLGVGAQPARQQHLLLVAAGQLADLLLGARGLDRQARDEPVDDRALARLVDDAGAGESRQQRERDVLAHRHVGNDALDLAILGAEADAERDRVGRLAGRSGLAHQSNGAGVGRIGAENGARDFGPARSQQAGEPDDLSGAHLDARIA